jgi:hypothetical protein
MSTRIATGIPVDDREYRSKREETSLAPSGHEEVNSSGPEARLFGRFRRGVTECLGECLLYSCGKRHDVRHIGFEQDVSALDVCADALEVALLEAPAHGRHGHQISAADVDRASPRNVFHDSINLAGIMIETVAARSSSHCVEGLSREVVELDYRARIDHVITHRL